MSLLLLLLPAPHPSCILLPLLPCFPWLQHGYNWKIPNPRSVPHQLETASMLQLNRRWREAAAMQVQLPAAWSQDSSLLSSPSMGMGNNKALRLHDPGPVGPWVESSLWAVCYQPLNYTSSHGGESQGKHQIWSTLAKARQIIPSRN